MKISLEEIEQALAALTSATTRVKEARRVAKKVYGNDREVSMQMKYAYEDVQRFLTVFGIGEGSPTAYCACQHLWTEHTVCGCGKCACIDTNG